MGGMIQYDEGDRRFNHRVAGAAIHRGRVLLHRAAHEDFWSLPGGRIEHGEASREALLREFGEELETEIEVGGLLWVAESFFRHEERDVHELGLYYFVSLPMGSPLIERDEPWSGEDAGVELNFRWFPLDRVGAVRLFPAFLKLGLRRLPEHPVHVIERAGSVVERGSR